MEQYNNIKELNTHICNFAILLLFLVLSLPVNSQSDINSVKVKTEGLSSNSITCIYQDQQEYIWIGTQHGLNRFDSYRTKSFFHIPGDTGSLSNSSITCIAEDADSNLWIGTRNGINRYNRKNNSFQQYLLYEGRSKIPMNNYIVDLYCDENKNFWILSKHFLYKLIRNNNKTILKQYDFSKHKNDTSKTYNYNTITSDNYKNIWLSSWWQGLGQVDTVNQKLLFLKKPARDFFINTIMCDSEGLFWLGIYRKEIYAFNPVEEEYKSIAISGLNISNDYLRTIIQDRDSKIWFGSNKNWYVLEKNNSRQWKNNILNYVAKDSGIINDPVKAIYEDHSGIVWIGYGTAGLHKYDPNADVFSVWYNRVKTSDKYRDYITCAQKVDDKMLLGSYDGGLLLSKRKGKILKRYTSSEKSGNLSDNVVLCFLFFNKFLWVGTDNGLNKFDLKTGRTVKKYFLDPSAPFGMPHNSVMGIYKGSLNNLWILTQQGFCLLNTSNDKFIENKLINSIELENYKGVFTDRKGNHWFYSEYGIAVHWKKNDNLGYFYAGNKKNSICGNMINHIHQDKNDNIWIATQSGLSKYNCKKKIFKNYYQHDGIADNVILHTESDLHGNIWILSHNGLTKYDTKKGTFKVYNHKEGLAARHFTMAKLNTNELIIAGEKGYYCFFPDSIRKNNNIPRVVITSFTLMGNEIKAGDYPLNNGAVECIDQITLKYDRNTFGFKFSALNYTLPNKNHFSYKLEDYDTSWHYLGNKNEVSFMNIPPGRYTFKVKGSNNDQLWNPNPTTVDLIITPPWWRTWWAYLLYFTILVIVFLVYRFYIILKEKMKSKILIEKENARKMHEIDEMKLQYFMNVSHEFKTPLTLITNFMKLMQERVSLPKDVLSKIRATYQNALRLNTLMNQLLELRKWQTSYEKIIIQKINPKVYLHKILVPFQTYAENNGITFSGILNATNPECWLDTEKTTQIIINLLSNAFKYSEKPGKVKLEATDSSYREDILSQYENASLMSKKSHISGRVLCVRIFDNGKGIAAEDMKRIFDRFYTSPLTGEKFNTSTGIGLSLVKQIVELIKGELYLESNPKKGSVFMLLIPAELSFFTKHEIKYIIKESDEISIHNSIIEDKLSQYIYNDNELVTTSVSHVPGKKNILIVEDNIQLLNHLGEILSDEYNVFKVINGRKGLNVLIDKDIDLIVSDIMMPEMGGIEMCRVIKNDIRICHIPVILLTAKGTIEDELLGFETGADDYISKPFDPDVLLSRISKQFEIREKQWDRFTKDIKIIPENLSLTNMDANFLKKALDVINKNISNTEFKPADLYKELNISRTNGQRKIKHLTNKPTVTFINSVRLKKAAYMLKSGDLISISELAYMLGFSSPSYFIRLFKKEFGVSPKQYSDNNKNI